MTTGNFPAVMLLDFVNLIKEQQELEASAPRGGLLVVFGHGREDSVAGALAVGARRDV